MNWSHGVGRTSIHTGIEIIGMIGAANVWPLLLPYRP
jgi:hypothetical protein